MPINFNTSNETLRQRLVNGITYQVPMFQRDYSWDIEQWEELWEDIQDLDRENAEKEHYMGYLVLRDISDNKHFEIIDGQQRITTASIIILAAISQLNNLSKMDGETQMAQDNKIRAEQLRNSYIGYMDLVTLVTDSKLKLNRHNDDFYQIYIVPLQEIPLSNIRASNKLLYKAFEYYQKKLSEYSGKNGNMIIKIIEMILNKLFFTVITVPDELNAFKVFETLNSRGVLLSSTDLLKNRLFSIATSNSTNEKELEIIETQWADITDSLGAEKFPDFLRVFWNSRYAFSRKANLFKNIRNNIQNREKAFQLLRDMVTSSPIYFALKNPNDSFWNSYREEKRNLNNLKTFSVTQPLSLLLACYEKFAEENQTLFAQILRAIETISFRYNVICGLNPNEQEKIYVKTAKAIMEGKLTTKKDIFNELKPIYPNDQQFIAAFEQKEFDTNKSRNKKIVRYILFALESKILNQTQYDIEDNSITIEHICPESPKDDTWKDTTIKQVHRIGNMTLLIKNDNRKVANKPFAKKLPIYQKSQFKITQDIVERYSDEWNAAKIESHQKKMAETANVIWKLDF